MSVGNPIENTPIADKNVTGISGKLDINNPQAARITTAMDILKFAVNQLILSCEVKAIAKL